MRVCSVCKEQDKPSNHVIFSENTKQLFCVIHLPKGDAWRDDFVKNKKQENVDEIRDWRDNL